MQARRRKRNSLKPGVVEPQFLSVIVTPAIADCTMDISTDISCTIAVACTSNVVNKLTNNLGPDVSFSVSIVSDDKDPGEPLPSSTDFTFTITATEAAAPNRVNTYNGSFTTGDALPTIVFTSLSQTYHSVNFNFTTGDTATASIEMGTTLSYELGVVAVEDVPNTAFSMDVDGLDAEQVYFFRITAEDAQSNFASYADSFTTDAVPAPSFISGPDIEGIDNGNYAITWMTDVPASSDITWGFGGFCGPFDDGADSDGGFVTEHHLHARPTISCTTFYINVTSTNAVGSCETVIEVDI